MTHNTVTMPFYALIQAQALIRFLLLGFACYGFLLARAQEPEYRVVSVGTLGTHPTAIQAFPESIALNPISSFPTSDAQQAQPVAVAVAPDGNTIAVVTEDQHRFLILDPTDRTLQQRLTLTGAGLDVKYHPAGTAIYALSEAPWGKPAQVLVYSLLEEQWQYLNLPTITQPRELLVTPDEQTLIVKGTRQLCFIDLNSHNMNLINLATTSREWVFSPDGQFLYISNYGSDHIPGTTVQKVDLVSQTVVTQFQVRKNPGALSWSPDGRFLAVASFDAYPYWKTGLVEFIDTETNTVLSRPYQVSSFIEALNWLPDGRLIIAHANSFGYARLRLREASGKPYFFADERVSLAGNPSRSSFGQTLFDSVSGTLYVRFRDAIFQYDSRKNAPALRLPLTGTTTDMVLSPESRYLLTTTISEDTRAENQVLFVPTVKFSGIEQHLYTARHNAANVQNESPHLLFTAAYQQLWSVPADALCQMTQFPHQKNFTEVAQVHSGQIILGRDNSRLSFFDGTTGGLLRELQLGQSSDSMAITPNEHLAVVTNRSSNDVSVIDILRQEVVSTIPLGSSPSKLAVSDTHAVVLSESSSLASILDLEHLAVLGTVPLDARPSLIRLNSTGDQALILSSSARQVSVIEVATQQVVQVFSVPSSVHVMELNHAGNTLAIGTSRSSEIQLFQVDPEMGTWSLASIQPLPVAPFSAFFTPGDERLYVGLSFGRYGEGELRIFGGNTFEPLGVMPSVDMPRFLHFQSGNTENSEHLKFPDRVLKAHLVALYDQDCNQELSTAEIEGVTLIDFPADPSSSDRVRQIDGLEHFPDLQILRLPQHAIDELKVFPPGLIELNLSGNELVQLDTLPEDLRILDLSRNPLQQIDALSPNLVAALLSHTEIAALPELPDSLRVLVIGHTPITSWANISAVPLWWLGLSGHHHADVFPPHFELPEVRFLDLVNTHLTEVPDVSGFPQLVFLDLTENPLNQNACEQISTLRETRPELEIATGTLTENPLNCESTKTKRAWSQFGHLMDQIRSEGGAL